jgi:RNA polymerase sigma-70 factor (ECF subfamily)
MLRRKKELASLDHSEVDEKRSLTENVVDTLHRNQLRGWLETAVLGLPEKYRLIYIAREVNEFSTEKTAEMLDITPENVKVRLHRAKSIIRESLLQQAPVQELFPFGNRHCQQLTDRVMDAIRKNH